MKEKQITPGAYLKQLIDQKTKEVAATHNDAGLVSMWTEAVREVLAKFPNLSTVEKSALQVNVEAQIQALCTRTKRNLEMFKPALQGVAMILGTRRTASQA
jgi:hypothetical protein